MLLKYLVRLFIIVATLAIILIVIKSSCGGNSLLLTKDVKDYSVHPDSLWGADSAIINAANDFSKAAADTTKVAAPIHKPLTGYIRKAAAKKTSSKKNISKTDRSPASEAGKSGVLGYSFFKEMKIGETKNIHAFISIHHSQSSMRDTIRFINNQEEPDLKNDTVSIFTENILLFNFVYVLLIDPDSSFTITQIHDSTRQKVNDISGNHWQWAITAKTKNEKARLILKVVAEKETGDKETFEARTIPIIIHVRTNICRQVWIFMYENPKIVLTAIFIPVIGYFGKKYFDKKKGKGSKT